MTWGGDCAGGIRLSTLALNDSGTVRVAAMGRLDPMWWAHILRPTSQLVNRYGRSVDRVIRHERGYPLCTAIQESIETGLFVKSETILLKAPPHQAGRRDITHASQQSDVVRGGIPIHCVRVDVDVGRSRDRQTNGCIPAYNERQPNHVKRWPRLIGRPHRRARIQEDRARHHTGPLTVGQQVGTVRLR